MDWLKTNIKDRLVNHTLDFKAEIIPSNFEKVSFDQAATNVITNILKITNKKIFIGFSGGYDSEYIVRKLHSLKIDFVPVIIEIETLLYERDYAYKTLRELKLPFVSLKLSWKEALNIYAEYTHKRFNSYNCGAYAWALGKYVESEGGCIIEGHHMGGFAHPANLRWPVLPDNINERLDFEDYETQLKKLVYIQNSLCSNTQFHLVDAWLMPYTYYSNLPWFLFFLHTPQIVWSMLNSINETIDLTWTDYKSRVYNLAYRPKFAETSSKILSFYNTLKNSRPYQPKNTIYFGNKKILMKKLEL